MRYLILSDLHANWEALDAVVRHAKGEYDSSLCCGDLVGYGADPNPVVEWVHDHGGMDTRQSLRRECLLQIGRAHV